MNLNRYTVNLVDAKNTGITRGALTGLSTGALYLFMYGLYLKYFIHPN